MKNEIIVCSKCNCVYGGSGGWLQALKDGWQYYRTAGNILTLCPKDGTKGE